MRTGSLLQDAGTMVLLDGVLAENIFWQVAGQVNIGAGAHMEDVLLVKTDALFVTGSSLDGADGVQPPAGGGHSGLVSRTCSGIMLTR